MPGNGGVSRHLVKGRGRSRRGKCRYAPQVCIVGDGGRAADESEVTLAFLLEWVASLLAYSLALGLCFLALCYAWSFAVAGLGVAFGNDYCRNLLSAVVLFIAQPYLRQWGPTAISYAHRLLWMPVFHVGLVPMLRMASSCPLSSFGRHEELDQMVCIALVLLSFQCSRLRSTLNRRARRMLEICCGSETPEGEGAEVDGSCSEAAEDNSDTSTPEPPLFKKGDVVYYESSDGSVMLVPVLEVHLDDDLLPYYTIQVEEGREKQTDQGRLTRRHPHRYQRKSPVKRRNRPLSSYAGQLILLAIFGLCMVAVDGASGGNIAVQVSVHGTITAGAATLLAPPKSSTALTRLKTRLKCARAASDAGEAAGDSRDPESFPSAEDVKSIDDEADLRSALHAIEGCLKITRANDPGNTERLSRLNHSQALVLGQLVQIKSIDLDDFLPFRNVLASSVEYIRASEHVSEEAKSECAALQRIADDLLEERAASFKHTEDTPILQVLEGTNTSNRAIRRGQENFNSERSDLNEMRRHDHDFMLYLNSQLHGPDKDSPEEYKRKVNAFKASYAKSASDRSGKTPNFGNPMNEESELYVEMNYATPACESYINPNDEWDKMDPNESCPGFWRKSMVTQCNRQAGLSDFHSRGPNGGTDRILLGDRVSFVCSTNQDGDKKDMPAYLEACDIDEDDMHLHTALILASNVIYANMHGKRPAILGTGAPVRDKLFQQTAPMVSEYAIFVGCLPHSEMCMKRGLMLFWYSADHLKKFSRTAILAYSFLSDVTPCTESELFEDWTGLNGMTPEMKAIIDEARLEISKRGGEESAKLTAVAKAWIAAGRNVNALKGVFAEEYQRFLAKPAYKGNKDKLAKSMEGLLSRGDKSVAFLAVAEAWKDSGRDEDELSPEMRREWDRILAKPKYDGNKDALVKSMEGLLSRRDESVAFSAVAEAWKDAGRDESKLSPDMRREWDRILAKPKYGGKKEALVKSMEGRLSASGLHPCTKLLDKAIHNRAEDASFDLALSDGRKLSAVCSPSNVAQRSYLIAKNLKPKAASELDPQIQRYYYIPKEELDAMDLPKNPSKRKVMLEKAAKARRDNFRFYLKTVQHRTERALESVVGGEVTFNPVAAAAQEPTDVIPRAATRLSKRKLEDKDTAERVEPPKRKLRIRLRFGRSLIGLRAEVLFSDGQFYPGTIIGVTNLSNNNCRIAVFYDDGTVGQGISFPGEDVRLMRGRDGTVIDDAGYISRWKGIPYEDSDMEEDDADDDFVHGSDVSVEEDLFVSPSQEAKENATIALNAAIGTAMVDDTDCARIDPGALQRALEAGYSLHFVSTMAAKKLVSITPASPYEEDLLHEAVNHVVLAIS